MNHRRGQHFGFATVNQQNRHAAFDAFARDLLHHARALTVHRNANHGPVIGRIKARRCIRQTFASEHYLLTQQQRLFTAAACRVMQFGTERHLAFDRLFELLRIVIAARRVPGVRFDHANFERGGTPQNIFGTGGVLHTGQLHDDAISALLLDNRLSHSKLINAITQRGDILLQRELLRTPDRLKLELGGNFEVRVGLRP